MVSMVSHDRANTGEWAHSRDVGNIVVIGRARFRRALTLCRNIDYLKDARARRSFALPKWLPTSRECAPGELWRVNLKENSRQIFVPFYFVPQCSQAPFNPPWDHSAALSRAVWAAPNISVCVSRSFLFIPCRTFGNDFRRVAVWLHRG